MPRASHSSFSHEYIVPLLLIYFLVKVALFLVDCTFRRKHILFYLKMYLPLVDVGCEPLIGDIHVQQHSCYGTLKKNLQNFVFNFFCMHTYQERSCKQTFVH